MLETLGIENNHTMRVCRADDLSQQRRLRELRAYSTLDQQYPPSNDIYAQQRFYYPQYQQPFYSNYPTIYEQQQQQYVDSPR